jgi:4'-phosphopantetheinyl transferase
MYAALQHEVHVWLLCSASASEKAREYYASILAEDEEDRLQRLRTERLRGEFLVARGALRELLGMYLRVSPEAIVFERNPHGKPRVAFPGEPRIEFSLSHGGGKVAYAFSADRAVGIDLEPHDPAAVERAILPVIFTEDERAELASLPPELAVRGFFCGWTRKEAFVKATGEGVSRDLQSFAVTLDPRKPAALAIPGGAPADKWHLHSLDLCPGYEAALVVAGDGYQVRLHRVDDLHAVLG